MTAEEIKVRLAYIDHMQESESITDKEYDQLEEETRDLYLALGKIEGRNRLKSVVHVKNLDDWTIKFLSSFSVGTRKITNKQAEIFYRINHGKPFIFNGKYYNAVKNYRIGFGTLIIMSLL